MQLSRESGLKQLDETVLKFGYVSGTPYSFKDHEYQIEIIKDTSARIAVQKCSQVGLSELMVQKILAMAATMQHVRIIFTLPTKEMAMAFSKDRFDGAIDQSPMYTSLVESASNSASQKKIGTCTLYVSGSFGANSAISVPAEVIISDEEDFSNPEILGKLNSRLRHASFEDQYGNRGIRMRFSTPTVEDYGVNLGFKSGDQKYYLCKCEKCEKWVLPNPFNDFVLPGVDKSLREVTRDDLPNIEVQNVYIKCNNCGHDLKKSLLSQERRQWVAQCPEKHDHSYQVYPWDVPKYNTAPSIIKQLGDYPLKSDFYNFVIGIPYSDDENTFTTTETHRAKNSTVIPLSYLSSIVTFQTFAGMDVGKTCHLVIGRKLGKYIEVVYTEKVKNSKEDPAAIQVCARYDYFRVARMCIDAGPDITLVNTLIALRPSISAVVYVRSVQSLSCVEEKQGGDVVNADRTKTLSLLMNKHNSGEIKYPVNSTDIYDHLKTTKKIREQNSDGTMVERFTKTSDTDHWVHALNYMMIASITSELSENVGVYAPPTIGKVRVGGNVKL